ncbi:MAG TPA: hypothetical protein VIG51_09405 [Candidatus Baltobacteraceae bacterium]
MKQAIWRASMGALVCIGLIYAIVDAAVPATPGDFGFATAPTALPNGSLRVLQVDRGGSAARAGIAPGDALHYSLRDIAACRNPRPDDTCHMTIDHLGSVRHARLNASKGSVPPLYATIALIFVKLTFLVMGALLVWKRADERAARSLSTFFICFGLAAGSGFTRFHAAWQLAIAYIAVESLFVIGGGAAVLFATCFPQPDRTGLRAVLRTITPPLVAILIGCTIVRIVASMFGKEFNELIYVIVLFWVYAAVSVVASLTIALLRSSGIDRQRLLWVAATFAVGFSGLIVNVVCLAFNVVSTYTQLATLTIACIPVGLGYVVLKHRLLDITFVINRAVVFAIVSFVIVAAFVVLETLLGRYVERASHTTSTVVELVVALSLGLSVRALHSRIDRFVDDVFFRERHLAEKAIRTFAHDAPLITDEATLLGRAVETAELHGQAIGAGIWLRDEAGAFAPASGTPIATPAVSENDPAVLAMRSRHVAVDLLDVRSDLPGAYAFPMIVRGRLIGALVCGVKKGSQTYAPDEREALEAMAHSVGNSIDGLRIRTLRQAVAGALSDATAFEAAREALARLARDDGFALA